MGTEVKSSRNRPQRTATDLTERKQVGKALPYSEEYFRPLIERALDVVLVMNRDGSIRYESPSIQNIIGYTPEERQGKSVFDLIHPDDMASAASAFSQLLQNQTANVHIELRLQHKDGSWRFIEALGQNLLDHPAVAGIVVNFRDITDRKRAEEALRESEQKYRTILEDIEDGYYEVDIAGNLTFFNDAMCGINGYSKDEMMGMNNRQYMDKENARKVYQAFNQVYTTGKHTKESGWEIVRKDGTKRFIEASVSLKRNSEGEPIGFRGIARDITERRRTEEALQESEEKFRRLVEDMNDGYCVLQGSRVVFANTRSAEMFGYAQEDVIGKTVQELLSPEIVSELSKVRAKRQRGETVPQQYETLLAGKDGTTHPVELGTRVIDYAGKPALSVVVRDITERKQAEEIIREAERRYKALFDNHLQMVYINDEKGLFLDANDYALERLGYTRDELGKTSFQDILHPEDHVEAFAAVADILDKGFMEHSIELRLITKSGETIWVETFNIPLERGADHYIGLGVARDITDRKQAEEALQDSEEHYSALVGSLTDAVIKFKGGVIVWCNDRVEEIYGYKKDELIGNSASFFFPKDISPSEFTREVATAIKERGLFRSTTTFQKKDGSFVDIEYSISQIPGKDPVEVVAVARDITERKQAEQEVRRLNEELEQRVMERTTQLEAVNKELESFAYSVSHDLRAPLRSIDGFSQVLLEDYAGKLDEEGKDYLQRVRSGSQRMAELIDDILNLSRVTRGEMRRETVDLSALAQTIATELQQSQPQRQVEFTLTPGLAVTGDGHLLRVALENLLDNAWKFTNKRSPATIEFGCTETSGQSAYFVRDNGVGFDMAYADKLFGAFQRLHSSNEFEGTGIGLATVQRIIHRHGGNIWAESAVDQGATFYFTLQPERGDR